MRTKRLLGVGLLAVVGLSVGAPLNTVLANDPYNTQGFRKAVTLAGIREHQAAFQAHADANGGNRVAGGAGYDASANYVVSKLQAAGYTVSTQEFPFVFNADQTPPVLAQTSPTSVNYVDGVDFFSMTYSPNGDDTASVYAVDLIVPSPAANASTSGCEAADFAGFPAGAIALMQRGTCSFEIKAINAAAAGAAAAIIFNEGNAGRTATLNGTLSKPQPHAAQTVGTSFAVGDALRNGALNGPTGTTARVRVDRSAEDRTTRNVIAETAGGDPNRVIVVGSHLDSVSRGPGINDNGSGSATILEVAETLASQQRTVRNKIRFIWWGAEELGLLGSRYYVSQLSQAERDKIELNLNFDMIGSPNYVRFVYDGNNSAFPVGPGAAKGPAGSGAIEEAFHAYFASQNLKSAETPFSGRSDYGPFIEVGIPAGGLFTGAEGIKDAEQAGIYGGKAGEAFDKCYHLACDDINNVNLKGLDEMSDAVAHSVLYFSKWNFDKYALVDGKPTKGQGNGGEGGGLHDDHDHDLVAE